MKNKKWLIEFDNGICGCGIEEEFEGTREDAIQYAQDCLPAYAEDYAYAAFGWGEEYTEEEYEGYLEYCSYYIEEIKEEE